MRTLFGELVIEQITFGKSSDTNSNKMLIKLTREYVKLLKKEYKRLALSKEEISARLAKTESIINSTNGKVYLEYKDTRGDFAWVIQANDPVLRIPCEFWFYTFDTKEEAVVFCKRQCWQIQN